MLAGVPGDRPAGPARDQQCGGAGEVRQRPGPGVRRVLRDDVLEGEGGERGLGGVQGGQQQAPPS